MKRGTNPMRTSRNRDSRTLRKARPMTTVAFLGLGNMGGPMAANLLAAGYTVRGFDPLSAARDAAERNGAAVFTAGADAVAGADVVITSLPNGAVVHACYAEALPVAKPGALFIDTSTISVADAREINSSAEELGMEQIDAPVSGGVNGATAGTLAFMVGGREAAVERARPILEPMAGKIIHTGQSGTGQAAKLCNNMMLGVQQIAVGEAFVLAEKLGLSAQSLYDVVTGATSNCWSVEINCPVPGPVPTSPANSEFKPGFATALMHKDLGLAMAAVATAGTRAPLGSLAAEIYLQFNEDNAHKDFSAVIELMR
ncbi:3-hydroxyisobutyrate dehydrogenase [Mycolicibacterium sp.]|uniref:3-hydroxyisobutyrate dehydrogenase n=1 Tax=Mycolicibacterium sp. TaxID=2320850 RepID=UPI0022869D8D